MPPFDDLLASIGFGAADAASQEGQVTRKSELAKSNAGLEADENRQALNASYEGRGVYQSGEALLGNARLEAKSANVLSGIDISTADDYMGLQRQLQQDKANSDAQEQAFNLQKELANKQYELQKSQFEQQRAAQQRYEDAYFGGRNFNNG